MGLFRSSANENYCGQSAESQTGEDGSALHSESALRPAVNRDSVVAQGQLFEGKLCGEGSVRVDGVYKGEISLQGSVSVSMPGSLYGTIEATNVLVSGVVEGSITAHGKLRLASTCSLKGDVQAETLVVEDGARFNGRSSMLPSGGESGREEAVPALEDLRFGANYSADEDEGEEDA